MASQCIAGYSGPLREVFALGVPARRWQQKNFFGFGMLRYTSVSPPVWDMQFSVDSTSDRLLSAADSIISNLVHDLRQPLSNIESTVCYLRIQLQRSHQAGMHLDLIETQVEEAEQMLADAVFCLRQLRAQRDRESEVGTVSLELTNSATAALT